ncbi:peptidyl-tRNA hydrolase 2, mitochondrial [Tetranychus urticae]|uniref:peptidyl-tRNA hydrolase n=1 Tax=Tetranychus urticae TaxID=32264 RepID=T1KJR8_TETUR|nr:peptidyl-tRNA hydrolase 2, mitochondrial [Tetranychus urticae]
MAITQFLFSDFNVGIFTGISVGLAISLYFRSKPSPLSFLENLRQIVMGSKPKSPEGDVEYKMVLVVNQKLKMEKGVIVGQCGHAAISAFTKTLIKDSSKADYWASQGSKKIVLKGTDDEHLENLEKLASDEGLITGLIRDSERSAEKPNGSVTALAIGPDQATAINKIVGGLKLY